MKIQDFDEGIKLFEEYKYYKNLFEQGVPLVLLTINNYPNLIPKHNAPMIGKYTAPDKLYRDIKKLFELHLIELEKNLQKLGVKFNE